MGKGLPSMGGLYVATGFRRARGFICTTADGILQPERSSCPCHPTSTDTAVTPTCHLGLCLGLQPATQLTCLCFDETGTRP